MIWVIQLVSSVFLIIRWMVSLVGKDVRGGKSVETCVRVHWCPFCHWHSRYHWCSSFLRFVGSLFHNTAPLNVTDLCRNLASGLVITNFSDPLKLLSFFVIIF